MITAKCIGTGGLGRFGNQMFTIAGCIGIATKSGQPFAFPEWYNRDNAIFGDNVDKLSDYFENPLPIAPDGIQFQDYGYFWGYRDIVLPTGSWSIDAHMQSFKFFEHCIDTVRHYFRMKDEEDYSDWVAVHWRAGDYIDDPTAQHPRCGKEYYEKAMALFPNGTKFFVFSDDPIAAKDLILSFKQKDKNFIAFANGNTYIEDFRLMKRCQSFICANSSFSYMAALLGEHPEKKIIMPSRWFGSQMPPEFDTKDIYPEGAVVI